MTSPHNLTELIEKMQSGDRSAGDTVFTACASRLRKMSASMLARERTNGLHPSDLVQETFAQKVAASRMRANVASREHFFSLMAAGMRQVLTDRGRTRGAQKRQLPDSAEVLETLTRNCPSTDLALALQKLEKIDPSGRNLIRLKFEHGLTWDELAAETGNSISRLRAECDYAVGWLREQLT